MVLNHTINHICKGAVSLRIINTTIFTVIVVHLLEVSTPSSAQVSAKNYCQYCRFSYSPDKNPIPSRGIFSFTPILVFNFHRVFLTTKY